MVKELIMKVISISGGLILRLQVFLLMPALLVFTFTPGDTSRVVPPPAAADSLFSESDADNDSTVLSEDIPHRNSAALKFPTLDNGAFSVGEKLYFDISYGFIHAGTATMEVQKIDTFNDRDCYHIQTTARSAAGFNFIYRVEDVVNSYMDKQGLFSWKFDKKLREGGYKADLQVLYYPADSLARVSFTRYKGRMKVFKQQNFSIKTPPFTLDILASLYYTRTQKLEVGKSIFITNHDNKKIYDLEVKVHKTETIEADAGKFECLLVEPVLRGEGLFKQKGRLQVWLTNDQYKIPVRMTTEIAVGHITTELNKVEGIKGKIPARR
jgi:hypothetical protein